MKQTTKESLKDYIHWFNKVTMDVPSATFEVLISAFSQGLQEGDLFQSLVKNLQ